MRRVLITGSAGFLASHFIEGALKETDWQIVGLDRLDETSARYWTDKELNRWLNEGAQDVARRGQCLPDTTTTAPSTSTLTPP